eukprot:CAMPEP_0171453030 /NCGR_PEP_ID=MMETSP0945-20130129/902_1 /TAXON_ID=109269 /ORGANISM="Vaucheria litorea, Strain CCMP2940" /LENGTH=198 /DNA_ID=CAMNT_0011977817 /DNA_START=177 /DNA_END=773 /DNA_ORIENTATION=-
MAGEDKKLSKKLEKEMTQLSMSPGTTTTNIGPLSDHSVRRILIDLIITMNAHFPDYDFSAASVDHFQKQKSVSKVMNFVNTKLADLSRLLQANFFEHLWSVVNDCIKLRQCEVYSFLPDVETGDPFSDGCMWSFNFFFYNPNLKKMLYFTCLARSKFYPIHGLDSSDYYCGESEDYDDDISNESKLKMSEDEMQMELL